MAVIILNLLLIILLLIIVLNFGAYSLLLKVISLLRKVEHEIDPEHCPSVTLLIAAYNEEHILQEKLENTLALDYPEDRLDVVVVSDGSTDNTNTIARQYENRIKVIVVAENQGKAAAINTGMEAINSDIVVMSDANVIYEKNVIRKLVRHFADPHIGAVSGKVVLLNEELSYSKAEKFYYSVEHNIQKLESRTGNLIGADGAMYAIRRELFRPLQIDTLLDDFVLSMGVIQQGKRLIFDEKAMGFEKNLSEIESEFNRKVRIVAGGIQSLKRKTSWPPKGQKLTAIKYIFHKIIRWTIGPVTLMFIALMLLKGVISGSVLTIVLTIAAVIGYLLLKLLNTLIPSLQNYKTFGVFNYVMVMISASVVGCYKSFFTREDVSWK